MSGNRPVPPPDYPKPQPAPNSARCELVEPTSLQGAPFPPASCVFDGAPVSISSQQLGQPAPAYSQEVSVDHVPPPPPPVVSPPESPNNDTLAQGLDIARLDHAERIQSPRDVCLALLDVLPLAVTLFHFISNLEADDEQALSRWFAQLPSGPHPPPPPVTPGPKPPKYGESLVASSASWVVQALGGHPPPPPPTPPPKAPKQSPVLESTEPIAYGPEGHPPPPPPTPPPKEPKSKSLALECGLSLSVANEPTVWGSGGHPPPPPVTPPPKPPKYGDSLVALLACLIVQATNGQHLPPPPPTPPPKAPNQKQMGSGQGGNPPPPPPTPPPPPPKSKSSRLPQLERIQPADGHAPKPVPPVPHPDPVPPPRSVQTCAAELGSFGPVRAFSTVALAF